MEALSPDPHRTALEAAINEAASRFDALRVSASEAWNSLQVERQRNEGERRINQQLQAETNRVREQGAQTWEALEEAKNREGVCVAKMLETFSDPEKACKASNDSSKAEGCEGSLKTSFCNEWTEAQEAAQEAAKDTARKANAAELATVNAMQGDYNELKLQMVKLLADKDQELEASKQELAEFEQKLAGSRELSFEHERVQGQMRSNKKLWEEDQAELQQLRAMQLDAGGGPAADKIAKLEEREKELANNVAERKSENARCTAMLEDSQVNIAALQEKLSTALAKIDTISAEFNEANAANSADRKQLEALAKSEQSATSALKESQEVNACASELITYYTSPTITCDDVPQCGDGGAFNKQLKAHCEKNKKELARQISTTTRQLQEIKGKHQDTLGTLEQKLQTTEELLQAQNNKWAVEQQRLDAEQSSQENLAAELDEYRSKNQTLQAQAIKACSEFNPAVLKSFGIGPCESVADVITIITKINQKTQ